MYWEHEHIFLLLFSLLTIEAEVLNVLMQATVQLPLNELLFCFKSGTMLSF